MMNLLQRVLYIPYPSALAWLKSRYEKEMSGREQVLERRDRASGVIEIYQVAYLDWQKREWKSLGILSYVLWYFSLKRLRLYYALIGLEIRGLWSVIMFRKGQKIPTEDIKSIEFSLRAVFYSRVKQIDSVFKRFDYLTYSFAPARTWHLYKKVNGQKAEAIYDTLKLMRQLEGSGESIFSEQTFGDTIRIKKWTEGRLKGYGDWELSEKSLGERFFYYRYYVRQELEELQSELKDNQLEHFQFRMKRLLTVCEWACFLAEDKVYQIIAPVMHVLLVCFRELERDFGKEFYENTGIVGVDIQSACARLRRYYRDLLGRKEKDKSKQEALMSEIGIDDAELSDLGRLDEHLEYFCHVVHAYQEGYRSSVEGSIEEEIDNEAMKGIRSKLKQLSEELISFSIQLEFIATDADGIRILLDIDSLKGALAPIETRLKAIEALKKELKKVEQIQRVMYLTSEHATGEKVPLTALAVDVLLDIFFREAKTIYSLTKLMRGGIEEGEGINARREQSFREGMKPCFKQIMLCTHDDKEAVRKEKDISALLARTEVRKLIVIYQETREMVEGKRFYYEEETLGFLNELSRDGSVVEEVGGSEEIINEEIERWVRDFEAQIFALSSGVDALRKQTEGMKVQMSEISDTYKYNHEMQKKLIEDYKNAEARHQESIAQSEKSSAAYKELAAQSKESSAAYKELAAQSKESSAAYKELAAQSKESSAAYKELQHDMEGVEATQAEIRAIQAENDKLVEEIYRFKESAESEKQTRSEMPSSSSVSIGNNTSGLFHRKSQSPSGRPAIVMSARESETKM